MGLSSFVKNAIKAAGTVSKKGVEIGSEAIGTIAEKIDSNPQSKEKIIRVGKDFGKAIKNNADQLAEGSVDYVDKAVDITKKLYKNVSEEILTNVNNTVKKYSEYQENNKVKENENNIKTNEYMNSLNGNIPEVIKTKIVGVTFENRQPAVMRLKEGQEVRLVREPSNSYDKNAVAVKNQNYQMLGYVPKEINSGLANAMDNGIVYKAVVTSKNGGDGFSYGASIKITKVELDLSNNNENVEEQNNLSNQHRSNNVVDATFNYSLGDYEGTYQLLKNENKSRPKVLSMLGASCFFTGRFEESYRIYNKLFLGDSIYFDELGCSLNEYDAFGRSLYEVLENIKIYELNLPENLDYSYPQSIERADEQYPDLDEFIAVMKLEKDKQSEFLRRVEAETQSDDAEIKASACFNAAEVYYRSGQYEWAFSCYRDSIESVPSKALYYGYATQALMRMENKEILMASYIRRAVELDPLNARWHMILGITLYRLGQKYQQLFLSSVKQELEKALEYCRQDQVSLKKAIIDFMQKVGM